MRTLIAGLILSVPVFAAGLPPGYWPVSKSQPVVDVTQTIRLAPDLSALSAGEKQAVRELLAAGAIMQELYELARHHQALAAAKDLQALHSERTRSRDTENLLLMYHYNQGPIATTLENKREPFLPVEPEGPGKNVYPLDLTREELDSFLKAHPEQEAQLLAERTVVRRATVDSLRADLKAFATHPALDVLHAGVRARLEALAQSPDPKTLYAVPYAVAYADRLHQAHRHLHSAANAVQSSDPELAGYLRNRARDLLTNDYESGDASWVTGRFKRLNAQVGAYETYDDALYGAKAFHALSLLILNEGATAELRSQLGSLQDIENALPYEHHKTVKNDIPVGVYEIIADFGQSRGTNTATILPNDPLYARRYGRTILMRENILRHPAIHASRLAIWKAAMADRFDGDLDDSGNFYRTLWHEIGHYLGVDRDQKGRSLEVALADYADSIEEMKSDLVSLFALDLLAKKGEVDPKRFRSIQAAGILRTLQNNEPRVDQAYQRMQLVQFNFFLEQGLLTYDPKKVTLTVDYERYPDTIRQLLQKVLQLQWQGDAGAAADFYRQYTTWTPALHARLAEKIRAAEGPRFRVVRYAALGE
jgi:predicted Zn-dependent protease with MMP-like domain